MNNCIIYARVSTEKQEDSKSLENQIKRCTSYAEARGFNVIKVLSDVESGSKNDRKSYMDLKKCIKNKSFNILVVWEISRVSRNATEFLTFSEELRNNEIDLVCIQQNIDMSTPIGKATANLLAVIGELERDTIKTRVKDRMVQLIKSGRYIGKKPFGYNLVNKELVINPDEAEIIKDIFDRYHQGESREKIANFYNLSVSTITRRLSNPLYIGKIHYVGKNRSSKEPFITDGNHQSIIDLEFFEIIQDMIKSFKYQRTYNAATFSLSGLIYCECGSKMYGNNIKSKGVAYYSCRNTNKKISHSSTRRDRIESYVIEQLKEKIHNEEIDYTPENDDNKNKKIYL